MPEPRYPTLEEFRRRLRERGVEPDLIEALEGRAARESGPVTRVGEPATVEAVARRMVPGDVPAGVLASFVDEHFDRQLGRGDERVGVLPREELIPAGFRVLDEEASRRRGRRFHELPAPEQDELLGLAQRGALGGPEGFEATTWFTRLLELLLLGFGSDPRGMVQMGFPGPSFRPGHVWLDRREVAARAARRRGYRTL